MTIEEIKKLLNDPEVDADKVIQALKTGRIKPLPDLEKIKEEWEVKKHKTIIDKNLLPDRKVQDGAYKDPVDGKEKPNFKTQPVNRMALPYQKRIVNTAVSFAFGNDVTFNCDTDDKAETIIYEGIKKLSKKAKLRSFNRRAYRELLRSTEFAEYWYVVEKTSHNSYGFDTSIEIKVAAFNPYDGDELYPYFDEYGDMIVFSRAFTITENGKEIRCFEAFTDEARYLWTQDNGKWGDAVIMPHKLGKIPIVYVTQEAVEWEDVQIAIERLEFLLSKFAETNDYHASPTVFVKGKIASMPGKGESGKLLQAEGDKADAKYLSWDNAPQAVALEIENLLKFIHGMTQTPDISFSTMTSISNIAKDTMEMLFMDAYLKVEEKREILDDFLQRRVNIQKAFLGLLSNNKAAAESVDIEPEINAWRINDVTTLITNIMTATGGKAVMSRETGIKMLGWVEDADAEMRRIEEEERASSFESTNL